MRMLLGAGATQRAAAAVAAEASIPGERPDDAAA